MVDGNKYIKGMAVYSDDLPDGVDVMFNTNKAQGTPKDKVLKNITADPDNPFGSLIKAGGQSYYTDANGERQLSLINKRAEEGDWGEWSDNLPSQFLSKQSITMIKKQLNLASADKQAEFDEICSLTNPTVIQTLLNESIISPTIADRTISNFIFQSSTDSKITELTVDAQFTGDDLYTVISNLCSANNIHS